MMDAVADMSADGEPIPAPLAERHYSGEFRVHIPPEVHRALAMQAAEQGVSLNRLASAKLRRLACLGATRRAPQMEKEKQRQRQDSIIVRATCYCAVAPVWWRNMPTQQEMLLQFQESQSIQWPS